MKALILVIAVLLIIIGGVWYNYDPSLATTFLWSGESNRNVLIFTAWSKLDLVSMPHMLIRLTSFMQYSKHHGYQFVVFTDEAVAVNRALEVIELTQFPRTINPLPKGWLKVFAFKYLLTSKSYDDVKIFLYLDVDAVFYNFDYPAYDIFQNHEQSIYAQIAHPLNYLFPSHAIALKNSPQARSFVGSWLNLSSSSLCRDLNMEQGAFYAAVAKMFSNCPLSIESNLTSILRSKTSDDGNNVYTPDECISHFCGKPVPSRNHLFNVCINNYLDSCTHSSLYTNKLSHPEILLFPFSPIHSASHDGFTVHLGEKALKRQLSCPLIVHPAKNLSRVYTPNYDRCATKSGFLRELK